MSEHTYQVYVPVAVTIDKEGNLIEAVIDFEGAPWSYVDKQENIWTDDPEMFAPSTIDEGEEDWTIDRDTEERAITALNKVLFPESYEEE